MNPKFIIGLSDRNSADVLSNAQLERIKEIIENGGTVLLPSDTCYSLAAKPSVGMFKTLNRILDRENMSMSLTFSSMSEAKGCIDMNNAVRDILEKFTPGPITVVCEAKKELREMFMRMANSNDGTVGVRIPTSQVERNVAGATINRFITTVPVKDEHKIPVKNFQQAIKILTSSMKKNHFEDWAAVEGKDDSFSNKLSTVVRVELMYEVSLIREGEIPMDNIRSVKNINTWKPNND